MMSITTEFGEDARTIMSKTQTESSTFGLKDAADALNEQGYLFQKIIRERIQATDEAHGQNQSAWVLAGEEYPVTATDDSQTRIDFVLQHRQFRATYLCVECKRAARKYKNWLFFDKKPAPSGFSLETFEFSHHKPEWHKHEIVSLPAQVEPCSIFNYYLEGAIKRSDNSASSTETIEKAFRQLIAGQTGLMKKLHGFDLNSMSYRSIPVLLTTAPMFEAQFDADKIELATGAIKEENLKLLPLEFCGVDFHADDSLSLEQRQVGYKKSGIASDMTHFQTRTIFVVHAPAINRFFDWAGKNLARA